MNFRKIPPSMPEPNILMFTFILFIRQFLRIRFLWITYPPNHFPFTSSLVFVHFLVFAETESSSRGSVEIIETTVHHMVSILVINYIITFVYSSYRTLVHLSVYCSLRCTCYFHYLFILFLTLLDTFSCLGTYIYLIQCLLFTEIYILVSRDIHSRV